MTEREREERNGMESAVFFIRTDVLNRTTVQKCSWCFLWLVLCNYIVARRWKCHFSAARKINIGKKYSMHDWRKKKQRKIIPTYHTLLHLLLPPTLLPEVPLHQHNTNTTHNIQRLLCLQHLAPLLFNNSGIRWRRYIKNIQLLTTNYELILPAKRDTVSN